MKDITFTCVHCGQSLEADGNLRGQAINCPACSKAITVPRVYSRPFIFCAIGVVAVLLIAVAAGIVAIVGTLHGNSPKPMAVAQTQSQQVTGDAQRPRQTDDSSAKPGTSATGNASEVSSPKDQALLAAQQDVTNRWAVCGDRYLSIRRINYAECEIVDRRGVMPVAVEDQLSRAETLNGIDWRFTISYASQVVRTFFYKDGDSYEWVPWIDSRQPLEEYVVESVGGRIVVTRNLPFGLDESDADTEKDFHPVPCDVLTAPDLDVADICRKYPNPVTVALSNDLYNHACFVSVDDATSGVTVAAAGVEIANIHLDAGTPHVFHVKCGSVTTNIYVQNVRDLSEGGLMAGIYELYIPRLSK